MDSLDQDLLEFTKIQDIIIIKNNDDIYIKTLNRCYRLDFDIGSKLTAYQDLKILKEIPVSTDQITIKGLSYATIRALCESSLSHWLKNNQYIMGSDVRLQSEWSDDVYARFLKLSEY